MFPSLPHFTCGSFVCSSSARWTRQLHPWCAYNFSGVSLGYCQAWTPTSALEEPTCHQPIPEAFTCPWSFLPWPPKTPALHKAAEIKAIYKCQGPGIPISEAVDTFLLKGLTQLPKPAGDLSDWVPLKRTQKGNARQTLSTLKHKLAGTAGTADPNASSVSAVLHS